MKRSYLKYRTKKNQVNLDYALHFSDILEIQELLGKHVLLACIVDDTEFVFSYSLVDNIISYCIK